MKFYKLNNTWVSWNELHNGYGYTTEPSIAVTYKSAHNGSSWGEDAGSGYYVGDIDDMVHGSFWCDSDYGWFELDGLVWNPEIYPSNATPLMMQNGNLTSPAVSLESDGVTYYLIKVIVADTGWITADEAAELGWDVYDEMQGTFIVFDTVENKIVSAFTNELTYGEIEGIVLQSPKLVYGVDISVPTAQFWFTQNGRNETENTALQPNSTVTVYDESGDTITDEDTIGMYDTASILAYMQANGDMMSKQDDVLIDDNGDLGLQVDSGPISAWSVFAERVFTLSFANTQLPDITITMPADETGYKGTSITLPTMSGEYESGGKTWKPSAWDIGAFGSSYTLNSDTVAHLVFEEVQQYEEITLYMASGQKNAQTNVTSAFTGNVNANYCYQLYTDEQLTIPWTGYDYSNAYKVGYIPSSSGVWTEFIDSVEEMPDYVGSEIDYEIGRILLDTGLIWFCCNLPSSLTVTAATSKIVVRIYPKDQQHHALYFNTSRVYDNISIAYGTAYDMNGKPGTGSNPIPLTSNFPDKSIVGVYGSAGNLVSSGYKNFSWVGSTKLRVGYYNTDAGTLSARLLLFTTDQYIDIAYINTSGNTSVSSGSAKRLYSKDGYYLAYFPSLFTYTPLALFKYNGSCADDSSGHYINKTMLGNYTGPSDALCLKQTYGTISFSYIWFLRTPISQ